MDDGSRIRAQDLQDLYARWARAKNGGEWSRSLEILREIENYIDAGKVPDDPGPDRVLVRIRKEGIL